jgi:hypothetical protein
MHSCFFSVFDNAPFNDYERQLLGGFMLATATLHGKHLGVRKCHSGRPQEKIGKCGVDNVMGFELDVSVDDVQSHGMA